MDIELPVHELSDISSVRPTIELPLRVVYCYRNHL